MDALEILGDVLLSTAFLVLIVYVLWKVALWARTRARGAYVLGALFGPFMALGNVADPDYRIVNEAKRTKQKEEDDSGDPPDPDADGLLDRREDT